MFKDNFSRQAEIYAQFRPTYPPEMYAFLAALTPAHDLAWDCGTGNGQAALDLAVHYRAVVASDPSAAQIAHAKPHARVAYQVSPAEDSALPDQSVDLVTVATALHWFDLERFYPEVRRVLRPGGVLAAWAYQAPGFASAVGAVVRHFHDVTLDPYWQPENRLIEQGYETLPFPFERVAAPEYHYQQALTRDELIGYLHTWSGTQRLIAAEGVDATAPLLRELALAWPEAEVPQVATWPLVLKVGRS